MIKICNTGRTGVNIRLLGFSLIKMIREYKGRKSKQLHSTEELEKAVLSQSPVSCKS